MKKFLNLFVIMGLALLLVGCGGSDSPADKFGVDKEIKITDEITSEEMTEVLTEVEAAYTDINQMSIVLTMQSGSQFGFVNGEYVIKVDATDEENIKMSLVVEVEQAGVKETISLYVKNEVVYINAKMEEAELKWKLSIEDLMSLVYPEGGTGLPSEEMNPDEILAMLEEEFAYILEELQAEFADIDIEQCFQLGKDKKGNIIGEFNFEEEEGSVNARMVVSNGLLQYVGLKASDGSKLEISLEYKDIKIKYPEFKDYQDMGPYLGQLIG